MLPANPQCPNGIGAAFYDLDGTILNLEYISPRTIAAMEAATRAGCVNVVCTGRNFPIVPDTLKYGSMDLFITVNGGQIIDPLGNHLLSKAIPKKTALELALGIAERLGLEPHNDDGFIGYADLKGTDGKQIATIVHVDTVPVGTGWVGSPYEVIRKDGCIVGRGVADASYLDKLINLYR